MVLLLCFKHFIVSPGTAASVNVTSVVWCFPSLHSGSQCAPDVVGAREPAQVLFGWVHRLFMVKMHSRH